MLEATPPNKGMKLMNQWLQLSLVCWTSFGLSGCSSPAAPTASGGESPLQLRAVTPAIGNVLLRGSSVHMSLTLVSEIASSGHVSLSIQDQSRVSLLLSEPSADIEAPTRPVTINAESTGPSSRQTETETTAPTAEPMPSLLN